EDAYARNGDTYGRGEEGWFWYDDETEKQEAVMLPPQIEPPAEETPEEEPQEQPKEAEAPPPPGPVPMSVEWLRENLPRLRDKAIDNPTNTNVAAYMYAQRVMLDKADVFSQRTQQVVATDPLLDEENRFPFSTAFRMGFLRAKSEARRSALKSLAEKAGLFYFYRSDCDFCSSQTPWIRRIADDNGFILKFVSLDGQPMPGVDDFVVDQGMATELKIKVVPSLVLASPPDTYIVLTQGFLAFSELEKRILIAAEQEQLLDDQVLQALHPEQNGVLTPEQLAAIPDFGEDSEALVEYVRKSIMGEVHAQEATIDGNQPTGSSIGAGRVREQPGESRE
ncbi:MAG: conjugal transfer protein TraF, partial [Pseudomonadota bacterium]